MNWSRATDVEATLNIIQVEFLQILVWFS